MEITAAKISDIERIAEIHLLASREGYKEIISARTLAHLEKQYFLEQAEALMIQQNARVFVAKQLDTVLGFAGVSPAFSKSFALTQLFVHPSHWRTGTGARLIGRSVQSATGLGGRSLHLWTFRGNRAAQSAYIKGGFSASSEERIFNYHGEEHTQVKLCLDLKSV